MFSLGRRDVGSMFGQGNSAPSTGNELFDRFASTIIPLIRQREAMNRAFQVQDRNFMADREDFNRGYERDVMNKNRIAEIGQRMMVDRNKAAEPMDVRFGGTLGKYGATPYQEALLGLREKGLEQTGEKDEGKLKLDTFRLEETERKNKATEDINRKKLEETQKNNERRAELERKRIAISQLRVDKEMSDEDKMRLANSLEKELIGLRQDNTIETENLRGEIQTKLAELRGNITSRQITERESERRKTNLIRPDTPLQTKQRLENNIARLRIERPDLAEYLEEDPNTGAVDIDPDITPNEMKQLNQFLLSSPPPPVSNVNTGFENTNLPDQVDQPILMLLPDGKTKKMIPANQVAEAERRGAKRIQ